MSEHIAAMADNSEEQVPTAGADDGLLLGSPAGGGPSAASVATPRPVAPIFTQPSRSEQPRGEPGEGVGISGPFAHVVPGPRLLVFAVLPCSRRERASNGLGH
jgi:hypothetical protein